MNSQRIIAIVIRHLYLWPRTLERLMGAFGWPIFDLVIWGLVSSYLMNNSLLGFSLMTLIIGGVIFWTIVWRIQNDISVNLLDDAWNQNLLNLFSTPLTAGEFLMAMVILALIKVSLTLISLIVGGIILYHFNFLGTFGLYIPFMAVNLLIFGCSYGFIVNGLILRFGYTVAEFAWALIALVQPFSCVMYPLSSLPSWAQKIGLLLPTTYVFEEMRRIIIGQGVRWESLLLSFALNIFYLILALIFFRLMFENAREHGRLVKLN